MPEGIMGAVWAFGWGVAAASGALVGAILGLGCEVGRGRPAGERTLGPCRTKLLTENSTLKKATRRRAARDESYWGRCGTLRSASPSLLSFSFVSPVPSLAIRMMAVCSAKLPRPCADPGYANDGASRP
ncbi:MAG: hypothetical protein K0R41_4371 [Geminicoccaceae bacterium]|jgi:hypothetical protein|nr:hypothetical protein [Geminicoccaceae bacterium]